MISTILACLGAACDDPRSASEQLEPWVERTTPLAWQGPRAQDQALVFTTNLEFVVVKKLDEPRKVCSATSGSGGTEKVDTEVMGKTEVQVPGETRTICEEESTMDTTRVSRVNVVLKPKRGAEKLDPSAIQEVVLGYHAKDDLRRLLTHPDFELASAGTEDAQPQTPSLLKKLTPSDDTLLALKASGLKLTKLRVQLGDGTRFEPGEDISIEATVEPGSESVTTLGSPVTMPKFRTEERVTQPLKRDRP